MSNLLRRTKIASQAFLDIANWREVLPRASAGKTVTEIRLRRGPTIAATPEHALWPHFSDIWYHQSYTKHFSVPPSSVVVDVGANVGVFSLLASRTARIVYALEPSSSNFSLLRSNTSLAENVVPLQIACAREDGEAFLDLSSDPVSFSLASGSTSAKHESVEVISLATLFGRYKIERCDFLKLDCEGCEFEILLDSGPSALSRVERVVMEYHDHRSTRFSHRDLLRALQQMGFEAISYNPNGSHGMIAATREGLASSITKQPGSAIDDSKQANDPDLP
jgi:FkbM family methyltransferase